MNAEQRAESRQRATLEQLNAELAARDLSTKAFAAQIGMDYNTLRRYFIGERRMPLHVFYRVLDFLELDPVVFIGRVENRIEHG